MRVIVRERFYCTAMCLILRIATGPKVTVGHILVITYPIIIKFENYITYVKVIIIYKNQLICVTVAMATAIYMVTGICPHGKNYSE